MSATLSARESKLYPDPVCDICGGDIPVLVYGASRRSDGAPIECWRWTACTRCARDIDRENFEAIRRRLIQWLRLQDKNVPEYLMAKAADQVLNDFKTYALKEDE